jgi:glycine/D-amino acid oxidase-like deaminating enzyme
MQPPQSLWWSTLAQPVRPRESLARDLDVDVAIIGAGYTGLWTARELLRREPSLRIAILEQSVAGFGASGRNGGWASALYPLGFDAMSHRHGDAATRHVHSLLVRSVDDLGNALREDQIDAHFVKGGSLTFARNHAQRERLTTSLQRAYDVGATTNDVRWLEEHELYEIGYVQGALGASFTPHCARLHPARLVRGLSDVVEALGASIYENTRVTSIRAGRDNRRAQLVTIGATVSANYVVRASEGYTPTFRGARRTVAPLYSLMISTEPQSSEFWRDAGFSTYATFSDARHNIIYGQRTHDDRIAFGGRGAPYHFGSTIEERFDHNTRTFDALERTLRELFPTFTGELSHRWGGPLAMPRDHEPSVLIDYNSGLASAGGYTGDGVVLSRVSACALAELITAPEQTSEYTSLPFVQRASRKWEVEPFRWLGATAAGALARRADHVEHASSHSTRSTRWLNRLLR